MTEIEILIFYSYYIKKTYYGLLFYLIDHGITIVGFYILFYKNHIQLLYNLSQSQSQS